jgi:hypothetical protein
MFDLILSRRIGHCVCCSTVVSYGKKIEVTSLEDAVFRLSIYRISSTSKFDISESYDKSWFKARLHLVNRDIAVFLSWEEM